MYKNLLKACAIAVLAMGSVESAEGAVTLGQNIGSAKATMEAKVNAQISITFGEAEKTFKWYENNGEITNEGDRTMTISVKNIGPRYAKLKATLAGGLKINDSNELELEHSTQAGKVVKGSLVLVKDNVEHAFKKDGAETVASVKASDVDGENGFGTKNYVLKLKPDDLEDTVVVGDYKAGTIKLEFVAA